MPDLASFLRRLHLAWGVGGVIAFVLTGQYMDRAYAHLEGQPDGVRMLFRSAHIYLLLAALLNLVLGLYARPAGARWARGLQVLGSVAILAGPPLFLAAFAWEPWLAGLDRPWARPGIYLALAGGVLHALGGWSVERRATQPA